jgi:hypothetical protein
MAENLKTTRFNDGVVIPKVTYFAVWKTLAQPAYCWYDNMEKPNKNLYGAMSFSFRSPIFVLSRFCRLFFSIQKENYQVSLV